MISAARKKKSKKIKMYKAVEKKSAI